MKTTAYKSISKNAMSLATFVFTLITGSADAQNSYKIKTRVLTETVSKMTRFEVKEEQLSEFKKTLSVYVSSALASSSNIMAEAFYDQNQSNVLWLIERWNDKKQLENFSKGKQAESLQSLTEELLKNVPKTYYLKDLEPLTKEQWRTTAKKEDKQLVIMLFVDAKNGTQQNFKDTYHTVMPQFRSEPGVVTYQLSEIEGDDTQFVTYEKFRSQDAFQYHLSLPPIKPVIEFLETSIKNPPFQNGLHNLIEFAPLTRE